MLKIPCKYHPNSYVERICASSSCKRDPTLCWECMIDEADHARNHRDVMIDFDNFTTRLDEEFRNVLEKRKKDQALAIEGHLKLLHTKQEFIDRYESQINNRKCWVDYIIADTSNLLTQLLEKVKSELYEHYDERFLQYQNSLNFLVQSIQHRYGLVPLPTKEEMLNKLEELSKQNRECNTYVSELKIKLLPPEDLGKNLAFIDTFQEFQIQNEIVEELEKQWADTPQTDPENPTFQQEQNFVEIMNSIRQQCEVLMDEFKVQINLKDLILSRNTQYQNPDESLNILSDVKNQNSDHKLTKTQRQYDSPKLFETVQPNSPVYNAGIENTNSQALKFQSSQQSRISSQSRIKFYRTVETAQMRGVTSLLQVDQRNIASGSRDKTIRINNLEVPQQSYTLEGHVDQVTALCMFQEKLLISGGGNLDSSIIIWSLSTRKQINKLTGHQSGITSLIELSDNHSILSGSYDNLAIIWNVTSGKSLCALKKHTAMVSCLQLVKRDIVVTGSWDRTLAIWQLYFEGEEIVSASYLRDIKTEGAVLCVKKYSERSIIFGGTSNKVSVVDWMNGEIKLKLNTSQFGICDIICSDYLLGLGASDSTIRLWVNNQEIEVYRDHKIIINNYNTNPKMIQVGKNHIAVINNKDEQPHFNIFIIE
ncbi:unnamed protein product [Paramecium pentaurelia]|uniref:Uncharacterized protein n=1 Tax=Paramecium pentaurelia TaxID=43138 RepID=A0A8S1V689_9CILI|nr:unnamed protein product [Paramecium pentaurelia]